MDTNRLNVRLQPLRREHFPVAAQMAALTSGRSAADLQTIYERDLTRTAQVAQVGAFVDEQLIGFGRVAQVEFEASQMNQSPSGWYLLGVNVRPTHRRRGIATLLTNWRIDWLANRADQLFYVAVPTNVASIKLHEGLGFVKVQENVSMPPNLSGLTLFCRGIPQSSKTNETGARMLASGLS